MAYNKLFLPSIRPAFSVLELLISIGVITIITSIIVVGTNPLGIFNDTDDSSNQVGVTEFQKAIQRYAVRFGEYPPGITQVTQKICSHGITDASCVSLHDEIASEVNSRKRFMSRIPQHSAAESPLSGFSIAFNDNGVPIVAITASEDPEEVDTDPPAVTAALPQIVNKAVDVSSSLTLQFDEDVLPNTGNIELRRLSNSQVLETIDITGPQVVGGGSNTLTITPSSPLPNSTDVYVLIDAGAIADTSGNLFAGYTELDDWQFATTGVNGLFTNYDFTGGYTTDAYGDLPNDFIDYTNSFGSGDARSRSMSNDLLTLTSSVGSSYTMFNGIRESNVINQANNHSYTVRYRILENTGSNNRIRVYDGGWVDSTHFTGRDLNTWYTETYDMGGASVSHGYFTLFTYAPGNSASIEVDYVSITVN